MRKVGYFGHIIRGPKYYIPRLITQEKVEGRRCKKTVMAEKHKRLDRTGNRAVISRCEKNKYIQSDCHVRLSDSQRLKISMAPKEEEEEDERKMVDLKIISDGVAIADTSEGLLLSGL